MRRATPEKLSQLQSNPANIRNICILAHVDHGKTTLADTLVASNGIISQRMSGKLRYLDSREDEQLRGITMKSSAISLFFAKEDGGEFLINLIDSPGHVDFSTEVSTAVRLCDGALVVVDVVEGVSPQTHAVLRQAWLENIKPVLVLNKIDRLITELKMEPTEAHIRLQEILVQVNVVTSELFTSEFMEKISNKSVNGSDSKSTVSSEQEPSDHDWTANFDDKTEAKNIYFSPDEGNVIFASALDGWGFTIDHFAELYSSKLGINRTVLRETLWGDFYLNSKTKRIMKGAQGKSKKPLFVQFVLENIWSVYDAVFVKRDKDMTDKIVKSLNLTITSRDARHSDARVYLQAVLSQWLPMATSVLSVVVNKLPSPLHMCEEHVEKLLCSQSRRFDSLPAQTQELKRDFLRCSSEDTAPVIVFVSKMVPVEKKSLPHNKHRPLTEHDIQQRREQARIKHAEMIAEASMCTEEKQDLMEKDLTPLDKCEDAVENGAKADDNGSDTVFVAFARVFSGRVRKGQQLYVLGPKHDPATALEEGENGLCVDTTLTVKELSASKHITTCVVQDVYMFMGRELEAIDCVPAGNVVGLSGLEDHILKSGTVSSTVACPAFTTLYFDASPIVRVAIEPSHASDMPDLVRGLKLLNQADPCVQVLVQETGEHVIVTAGEVHLRKCLDDLTQRFTKVDINVSDPIVPFRETIVSPPKMDMVNESIEDQIQHSKPQRLKEFEDDEEVLKAGLVEIFTPNGKCKVRINAVPLPESVTNLLVENQDLLKTLDHYSRTLEKSYLMKASKMNVATKTAIRELKDKLSVEFKSAGKQWIGAVDQIWAFGPRRVGPNILLNRIEGYKRINVWNCVEKDAQQGLNTQAYDNSVVSGFQLATLAGPLCEEPLQGVCYAIQNWEYIGYHFRTYSEDENSSISESVPGTEKPCVDAENLENTFKSGIVDETLDVTQFFSDFGSQVTEGQNIESQGQVNRCSESVEEGSVSNSLQRTGDLANDNSENSRQIGQSSSSLRTHDISQNISASSSLAEEARELNSQLLVNGRSNIAVIEDSSVSDSHLGIAQPCVDTENMEATLKRSLSLDDTSAVPRSVEETRSLTTQVQEICSHLPENNMSSSNVVENDSQKGVFDVSLPEEAQFREIITAETKVNSEKQKQKHEAYGPMSGQLMSIVKDGCRKAFQTQPQRLMAAMYKCDIQVTSEVMGKLYAVVGKRNGRFLYEDMREGTQIFHIAAVLPVVESFGFAEAIRKKTSGFATPQLVFSHWEVIDVDPFWVPTTEEEYLHFGEKADCDNRARTYMNNVRKRKGLKVDEKIVEHGEKQRTLTKMK